jgi:hypothetical protein
MSQTVTPTSNLQTFLGEDPNVNRLYDNVQAVVPGVQLPFIQMQTWNTVEDFYVKSTIKRVSANWTMGIGVSAVDFNPWDETWLVAWILGFTGITHALVEPPGVLIDRSLPTQARYGTALLALKPNSFNAVLPVEVWSTWFEVVLDGVLSRIYQQPMKPYSSPQLAEYHGKRYRNGISTARAVAQKGNTDGGGRWRFPYFANGKRKN